MLRAITASGGANLWRGAMNFFDDARRLALDDAPAGAEGLEVGKDVADPYRSAPSCRCDRYGGCRSHPPERPGAGLAPPQGTLDHGLLELLKCGFDPGCVHRAQDQLREKLLR